MKSSLLLLCAAVCAPLLSAQAISPPASQPKVPDTSQPTQLHARGPEAVVQQTPDKVVATIDGKSLTAKQAMDLLSAFPPDQRKRYESNLSGLLQQIYMSQQLADLAMKQNLDHQSPWREQLQLARTQVLAQAYLNQVATAAPSTTTPADPQQYFNSHPDEFDQVKISGIFIGFNAPGTPAGNGGANRTEEQAREKANDLEKKLKAGADFSALARTDSDNQQAASRGGELGTFALGDPQLPADLKNALLKLQSGQTSEPIRIPTGLLIAKVDSRTKLSFDQAKPGIVQKLQNERNQAAVKQALDKYKIQVQDPDFFGGATASVAPPNTPSLQRPVSGTAPPPSASSTRPQP